ncbi:MAG: hypothetical protein RSB82_05075, partial [Victivallaceae bacterium]
MKEYKIIPTKKTAIAKGICKDASGKAKIIATINIQLPIILIYFQSIITLSSQFSSISNRFLAATLF